MDGKRRRKTVTARTYGEAQRKVTQLLEEIRTTGAPVNRNIRLVSMQLAGSSSGTMT